MSLRPIALISAAMIALLAACIETSTSPPSPGANPGAVPAAVASNGPEKSLKRGMTADAVKAIMGSPAEIKPMKAPTGTAEIWVYHRTTTGQVNEIQVGTNSTPISTINSNGQTTVLRTIDQPIFQQQTEFIDESIYLLMFDGRFQQLKTSFRTHFEYR